MISKKIFLTAALMIGLIGAGGMLKRVQPFGFNADFFQPFFVISPQEIHGQRNEDAVVLHEEVRRLALENEALRAQIGVRKMMRDGSTETGSGVLRPEIPARFLYVAATPGLRQFWIDRGSGDGVQKGMPVVAGGNVLIGVVHEAGFERSLVKTIFDPFFRTTVAISGEEASDAAPVHALARGSGDSVTLTFIENNAVINPGDAVRTDGNDGILPSGFLLGFVDEVRLSQDRLFQEGTLRPAADMKNPSLLFVVPY